MSARRKRRKSNASRLKRPPERQRRRLKPSLLQLWPLRLRKSNRSKRRSRARLLATSMKMMKKRRKMKSKMELLAPILKIFE
jgi:hypothetical protein